MAIAALVSALLVGSSPARHEARIPPGEAAPTPQTALVGLPISFEPNMGQAADGAIAYIARAAGYTALITKSGPSFWVTRHVAPRETGRDMRDFDAHGPITAEREIASGVAGVRFVGADSNATFVPGEVQPGITNYFKGNDPDRWLTDIPNYSSATQKGVWEGIDVVYRQGPGKVLEHDFVVAPGADPDQIVFRVESVGESRLTEAGEIEVDMGFVTITLRAPVSYQDTPDGRVNVDSSYRVLADSTYAYSVGAFDPRTPLIIDPATLAYSTYLGGGQTESADGVSVDSSGSAYVTGDTTSSDFPTASAFQSSAGGGFDAFVTKISPDGSNKVYSTYLGGGSTDRGRAVAVDAVGSAYVVGHTVSSNFPTASPFQSSNGGTQDAFVTKVGPSGSALVYSSYLGGASGDNANGVAVDDEGNAYVAGSTLSTNFPTASPVQTSNAGGTDAFAAKVNSSGSALSYSTYLGGSDTDIGNAVAVDSSGSAYLAGNTSSSNFPTVSPVQPSKAGNQDAFITKMSSGGSAFEYSSYLGGTANDAGVGIALDGSSPIVAGFTVSDDMPTVNALQPNRAGEEDIFLTKLSSSGSNYAYSTYLGGSSYDVGIKVATSAAGEPYVTGYTASADFPLLEAVQATPGGLDDVFVVALNASASGLLMATYLGGSNDESGQDLAVDSSGAAYIVGFTFSTDFPIASAFQPTYGGGFTDAFAAKLSMPFSNISGTFVGGQHGAISVYSTSGSHVAYSCCMTTDSWSIQVPASATCPTGYKVLWLPPNDSKMPTWFDNKSSYSAADCVSAPSSSNDMTLTAAANLEGYVKDFDTAADIDGAIAYAFDSSTGSFAGWSESGSAGPGRFRIGVTSPGDYKVRVVPPAGHVGGWYDGRTNYTEASPIAAPSTEVNFSLRGSGVIDGYVKSATTAEDLNGYPVYAYTEAGVFFGYGVTDRGYGPGRYRIEADPGTPYKLLAGGGGGFSSQWYSGSTNFTAATSTAAPFTANFSLS